MKYFKVLLACGIPLHSANGAPRKFVEAISEFTLDIVDNLELVYISKLLKLEKEMQVEELRGKRG
jgi:hypothetical protein